jgi:Mn-dependent DtxR family transcriptional regulator
LAEEFARHQETWTRWLHAVAELAAETDRNRAHIVAAHVEETVQEAIRARLDMVTLMPLEMRRRELDMKLQFEVIAAAIVEAKEVRGGR